MRRHESAETPIGNESTTLSEVISDFNEKIKQAMEQDAAYGRLKQQVKEGVVRRYWLDGDLLVAKGGR